jgi:hypothetical protein
VYGAAGGEGRLGRADGFREALRVGRFVVFFGVSFAPHTEARYPDISPLIPR